MRQIERIVMSISGRVSLKQMHNSLDIHYTYQVNTIVGTSNTARLVVEEWVALPVKQVMFLAQLFRAFACPGDQHVLQSARLRVDPQLGQVRFLWMSGSYGLSLEEIILVGKEML